MTISLNDKIPPEMLSSIDPDRPVCSGADGFLHVPNTWVWTIVQAPFRASKQKYFERRVLPRAECFDTDYL